MRLLLGRDFAAGLLFVATGALGLWLGEDYALGTPTRMGPGMLPRILCWILVAFGVLILVRGLVGVGERLEGWTLRPLLLVLGGLVAFGLLLEPAGLPVAIIAGVLIAAFGGPEFRLREAALLGVGLAVGCSAAFIWGLGLPMQAWPS